MAVLRGPADADHYRVKVGRYGDRWYTDPLPPCPIDEASDWQGPSISIVKKASGSDWSFVALKRVANDAQLGQLPTLEPTQRYDRLKSINSHGLNVAAGRGTIVHLWAEDLLNGRQPRDIAEMDLMAMKLPKSALEEALTYRAALLDFFDTYQPELVAAEVVCIHRALNDVGYGGTGDAIVSIDGELVVLDWKSRGIDSDHAAYPEEAAQVSALAGAEYMIVATDAGPRRALIPKVAGGLIVSVKPDGARCYPVDTSAGFAHWSALHAWWCARRDERKPIGRPWAPKVAAGGTGTRSSADEADPPAASPDKLRPRIAELIRDGHEDALRRAWPQGVPPLSKDGHTADDLAAILAAVQRVEADISAPFHPDDSPPALERSSTPTSPVVGERRAADEGASLSAGARQAVEQRFYGLNAAAKANVARVAKEANDADRSISVSAFPTERRAAIAMALLAWADDLDGLFVAASLVADDDQTADADTTLGGLLGSLTIEQANRLRDATSTTVAA
jgi:hypothetical protein